MVTRVFKFYIYLYDFETCCQNYTKTYASFTVADALLRDVKNETATGNDYINVETLKAVEDTTSKTLAKLYTKCLSKRRIPTA